MAEQLLRAGTQRSPRLHQPWGNFLLAGCGFPHPPPVVARLWGCQKVCVFVFPWVASGENIHHLPRPEAFLSESVGGCNVTPRLWGGVCCGLHRSCVQLGPQQVWACRRGVSLCGFVWFFGVKKTKKNKKKPSSLWLLVADLLILLCRHLSPR